jgi:hypothetical protein
MIVTQQVVGNNYNYIQLIISKLKAGSVLLSTEAFHTAGLALQLEVPTVAAASIPGQKVGEECWNYGLDGRLEEVAANIQLEAVVVATSEAARLWEDLPTASRVLDPYENLVT